jgi:DNA-binding NtrC family response regulator
MSLTSIDRVKVSDQDRADPRPFVARSPAMVKTLSQALVIAAMPGPVLILGESGTGKTRLCREIHAGSSRINGPFNTKGCGEFDEGTMEATLFGHTRDAYTSARTDQPGLLMESDGGTLLLDDIDCLSMTGQARLLRFLDDGKFYRLGDPGRPYHTDVRIIATTNKNLETLVRKEHFRQDLWYRLKRWVLRVPALRERPEDILALAEQMLTEALEQRRTPELQCGSFDADMSTLLTLLPWPGNIRDLQAAVENIALFAVPINGVYTLKSCAQVLFSAGDLPTGYNFGLESSLAEPDAIQRILALTRWNKRLTARIADISPTTLDKVIKEKGWRQP